MTEKASLREQICSLAKSLFEGGLTHGSTGNISARTSDGGLLVSPTGSSFGRLDPSQLSRFDSEGRHIGGGKPTKEMPLHSAFYDTRSQTGAVVHLHSCHAIAWSLMPDVDEDDFLPPLTPYAIMQLGRVKLLPFFRPGDPAMGQAVRGLAGKRSAVMLSNHGPVVAGKDRTLGRVEAIRLRQRPWPSHESYAHPRKADRRGGRDRPKRMGLIGMNA